VTPATPSPSRPPVHIAAICGSLRGSESCTRKALGIATRTIEAEGASVDLIDLGRLDLPLRESRGDTDAHAGTAELKDRVARTDSVLLGSPEYHSSFSGVLKNALDLLSRDEVGGKLFGLLGVSGGNTGAVNSLGHLRYVVRGVGGWSLPAQVSIANAWKAFDGDRLADPELQARIESFARELVRFTRLYKMQPEFEEGLIQVIDRNR
jgi:FMN reductase